MPRKSFDALGWRVDRWTARAALDLLPENNGPRVEVMRGCVVVTPSGCLYRRTLQRELGYLLKQAARRAALWLYHEVNIVFLDAPGGGRTTMEINHAVLLGEIVSPGNRRKDTIDRPREYAAAGVPFFLRVDLRNRVPTIALYELTEGEYRPVAAAAAGTRFVMREPFEFSIDPADLLGEEAAPDQPGAEG
ncbi:Uma2 family endonuclease [Micromonospora sp. DT44]|uniref:Uma2 family endonuclease n=1 Tax=Micromonospora sp. DT44 TaxID=3393439 RepID=UPI003CF23EF6